MLTSLKTIHGPVGTCTALIRDIQFKWQQILQSKLGEYRVHSHEATISCPQVPDTDIGADVNYM
jgi:hypothetical protein